MEVIQQTGTFLCMPARIFLNDFYKCEISHSTGAVQPVVIRALEAGLYQYITESSYEQCVDGKKALYLNTFVHRCY